eukprot:TRINITY_DN78441_c0_g1_i1.p1 TRINITY_DN78441_c0_g1~~TRINITY_DN78441_c0_g1_i1.p1  ORF type:complete len:293 (-),score=43.25 TRINITY_DN78441_c0_g1_i1:191-1069(-)
MTEHTAVGSSLLRVHDLPSDVKEGKTNNSLGPAAGHVKLVWHVRHGQSTGNAAKETARAADHGTGERVHESQYEAETRYIDARLTELGFKQAQEAQQLVVDWEQKPHLIVSSPLTRAIQTAAIMFERELCDGTAQLVVRPELREFWAGNNENMGRPLAALQADPQLQSLAAWRAVESALSEEATSEWRDQWNSRWACGDDGAWQTHVADGLRITAFSQWLSRRAETKIAIVSHWGTINNILNREPWSRTEKRCEIPERWDKSSWPEGGLARKFSMPNCGWVSVFMGPDTTTA